MVKMADSPHTVNLINNSDISQQSMLATIVFKYIICLSQELLYSPYGLKVTVYSVNYFIGAIIQLP